MIYIGQHQTENVDDGYMGSGLRIQRAIEKYGIENFEKTILFECNSEEEMNQKEAEIVNEDFIARDDVYNIVPGGYGKGFIYANETKLNNKQNQCYISGNKVKVVPLSDWQEYTIAQINAAMKTVNTLSETDKGAIAGYISTIESATTFDEAATAYYAALDLIDRQKALETKAQEALGTLGTRKEGPAIKVTGNDGETIILFNVDKVEFIEMELFGQGKAEANGIGKVRWMQLWRGGPKFAVYNVGATSATEYGGYYCWGKSNDESSKRTRIYNDGSEPLAGDTDTATKLWGNNWRMPTEEELEALANPDNCDSGWTTVDGVTGFMFTGKGDYKNNSIFFPANGYYVNDVSGNKGKTGGYWASTPREGWSTNAAELWFNSIKTQVEYARRDHGYCVRAVLNENKQN